MKKLLLFMMILTASLFLPCSQGTLMSQTPPASDTSIGDTAASALPDGFDFSQAPAVDPAGLWGIGLPRVLWSIYVLIGLAIFIIPNKDRLAPLLWPFRLLELIIPNLSNLDGDTHKLTIWQKVYKLIQNK